MRVITNNTLLRYLVFLGYETILRDLFTHLIVPPAVVNGITTCQNTHPCSDLDGVSTPLAGDTTPRPALAHLAATTFYMDDVLVQNLLARDAARRHQDP